MRAGEVGQVLVGGLRAGGRPRERDGGGHDQPEGEREEEEALGGHWPTRVPDHARNDNPGGSLDVVASGRRLAVLVVALALVGAPAVALRAFCVGKSCAQEDIAAAAAVPFCPLPAALRDQIVAGYRQGRSPDVMGHDATLRPLSEDGPASPYRPDANRGPDLVLRSRGRAWFAPAGHRRSIRSPRRSPDSSDSTAPIQKYGAANRSRGSCG